MFSLFPVVVVSWFQLHADPLFSKALNRISASQRKVRNQDLRANLKYVMDGQ